MKPRLDYFSEQAVEYHQFRPSYPKALVDFIVEQVERHELAIDVATGNGQLATLLSHHFNQVLASDISAEQLGLTQSVDNIRWLEARAEQVLVNQQADLITAAQAFHWFDHSYFFSAAKKQLAEHGMLALITYQTFTTNHRRVNQELEILYHQLLAPYWPPQRAMVENGYNTIEFPFATQRTHQFQLKKRWSADLLVGYINSWSATQALKKADKHTPELNYLLKRIVESIESEVICTWPLHLIYGFPNRD